KMQNNKLQCLLLLHPIGEMTDQRLHPRFGLLNRPAEATWSHVAKHRAQKQISGGIITGTTTDSSDLPFLDPCDCIRVANVVLPFGTIPVLVQFSQFIRFCILPRLGWPCFGDIERRVRPLASKILNGASTSRVGFRRTSIYRPIGLW